MEGGQGIFEAEDIYKSSFDSFNKRGSALHKAERRGSNNFSLKMMSHTAYASQRNGGCPV